MYPLWAEEPSKVFDLPLDQLVNVEVQSASRFKQKSSQAPSAVEVLTADNIRQYGWRTLADALNSIRGIYVRTDRNYTYLGNRGFTHSGDYNSRVLIMIDGRRMNETIFDSGFVGEEFLLDMNLIDRIEYIPGSGSSVYGANALLGVVNVITKSGKDIAGLKLSGEAGSLDTYRGRATFGKKWSNGAELLLNGSRFFSHGADKLFFPGFSNINGSIAQDMDIERNSRAFGKFSYGDFTLRGGFVDRYKRIPTAAYDVIFNDKDNYSVDSQGYIDLDYLTQINPNLGLEVRGFHHWYDYHSITPYEGTVWDLPDSRVLFFEGADSRWWGGEAKLTSTQFDHHKLIVGLEAQYDQRQYFTGYVINPAVPNYNAKNDGWRAGIYLQDEYRITDSLLINAGVRLDYHHMINSLQLNPRVGLIWDVMPTLTAKLLYSSAFRAPNILEHDINKGPSPSEELVKSYEAITEWYPGNGVKLLGTLFYNNLSHVIETQDHLPYDYVNTGKFQSFGFEFGGEKRWDNGRMLKLTWTHNSTRDKSNNENVWLMDSPKNMVKFHYSEPLFNNKLSLGFEEIFVDGRRTKSNQIAPGYHLFNISLAMVKPLYGVQASLGIYNVLDQHFKAVAAPDSSTLDTFAMDGRTVRFRLEYGF
ncbi:MAG: TonB-dependent receptor [Methyloglobulus sp.]|nr:TonB-dependent receptor [Methyloglobulus sp.]